MQGFWTNQSASGGPESLKNFRQVETVSWHPTLQAAAIVWTWLGKKVNMRVYPWKSPSWILFIQLSVPIIQLPGFLKRKQLITTPKKGRKKDRNVKTYENILCSGSLQMIIWYICLYTHTQSPGFISEQLFFLSGTLSLTGRCRLQEAPAGPVLGIRALPGPEMTAAHHRTKAWGVTNNYPLVN